MADADPLVMELAVGMLRRSMGVIIPARFRRTAMQFEIIIRRGVVCAAVDHTHPRKQKAGRPAALFVELIVDTIVCCRKYASHTPLLLVPMAMMLRST